MSQIATGLETGALSGQEQEPLQQSLLMVVSDCLGMDVCAWAMAYQ